MAQKVQVIYSDDLSGEVAEDIKTVTFGIDGKSYEIDLTSDNHDKLVEILNPYIVAGRRAGKAKTASAAGSGKGQNRNPDTAKIREWAKGQGYDVSERGRVPANIKEAYEKAHQ